MSEGAKAVIRLQFNSEQQFAALLSALVPETHAMETRRAKVKLQRDGSFLVLAVEADDTVALRATLNAYLRWIQSAQSVIDVVEIPKDA